MSERRKRLLTTATIGGAERNGKARKVCVCQSRQLKPPAMEVIVRDVHAIRSAAASELPICMSMLNGGG